MLIEPLAGFNSQHLSRCLAGVRKEKDEKEAKGKSSKREHSSSIGKNTSGSSEATTGTSHNNGKNPFTTKPTAPCVSNALAHGHQHKPRDNQTKVCHCTATRMSIGLIGELHVHPMQQLDE